MALEVLPRQPRTQSYVVQRLSGKLIGTRPGEILAMSDWLNYVSAVRNVANETAGAIVFCADYRNLQVLTRDIADAVVEAFQEFNPRIYRSALVLPLNAPTLLLQMERLLREARNLRRRTCSDSAEVKAWLSSCLDSKELAGLEQFLASHDR